MMNKDLSELNITEVVKTISADEANDFLKKGWKLIETNKTNVSAESYDEEIQFTLGKIEK